MGLSSLFGKPKMPKPPAVQNPQPLPTVETDEGIYKKFRKKRSGRRQTIVTGDLTPDTGRRSILG